MTKLEKLASGRELRMLVVSLKERVETPFAGTTFRAFRETVAAAGVRNWHFAALYAGEAKIYETHRY